VKKTELLAPAGSYEALVAAVQNGADAVYLGGKSFGARQYASNFDEDGLKKAVKYCHLRDVKVYVTVNTLVRNDELQGVMEYIDFLYNNDVDAVIVQDLGILKYIRDNYPDLSIHSSTQMTIHNLEGAKLLKELGVKRVVVAREMSLEEIINIKNNLGIELEVFIHGALCICYSGQCLMSSHIGGRSGNRGRCAQPCRLPYKLVELESGKELKTRGDYILSPRDLNTIEYIEELIKLGVSLKIEGRMKKPEYVSVVVKNYRRAIDYYHEKGKVNITKEMRDELEQIFNRKFTKGYLFGESGKDMMSYEKPGNRGVVVGRVIEYNNEKNRVVVKLTSPIRSGDGIRINTENKDIGMVVKDIYKDKKNVDEAHNGDTIELIVKGRIEIGDIIFKTSDKGLLDKAREGYQKEYRKIPIQGIIKGKIGDYLKAYAWDSNGNYAFVKGSIKIEMALKVPLDEERIYQQMNKLGDTPFIFEDLKIDIDSNISLPLREINRVRRELIEELSNQRANRYYRQATDLKQKGFKFIRGNKETNKKLLLSAYASNKEQFETLLKLDIDIIYYKSSISMTKVKEVSKKDTKLIVPALNIISKDNEMNYDDLINSNDNILVGNLGQLNMFKDKGINIFTDLSFNVFNSLTINKLKELGVSTVTLSTELTLDQLRDIPKIEDVNYEIIGYGHLPLMTSEYCPLEGVESQEGSCKGNCNKYGLKDRYGFVFPIQCEDYCRIRLLNPQKLFNIEFLKEFLKTSITQIRLQFTNEDKNEIISIVQGYRRVIDNLSRGVEEIPPEVQKLVNHYKSSKDYTKGHFYRGVF